MQGKCRGLYNWWVGRLRDGERWNLYEAKKSLQQSKQHDSELQYVYGKLLHEVYFRLNKAMKAFYRRVKAGDTPGFPRYRKRHEFFTLCYPAMYIATEGDRLILPTGGKGDNKRFANTIARLSETPPATFKEVAITRDARGNYYASFVSEQPEQPTTGNGVIAFDLGMKTLATGVNEQGDLSQRQMVTKQRQERKKSLNRAVFNDWGLYTFLQMLHYKCQLYGKEFHQISERDTSKTCHVCGKQKAMPLYKRTYRCENCGLIVDRDENSAQNILMRFLARLEPHTGDPVRCADVFTGATRSLEMAE